MIFQSKKATVTAYGATIGAVLISFMTWLLPELGAPQEITEAALTLLSFVVAAVLSSYNIGQGLADHGKEAAKIKAEKNE